MKVSGLAPTDLVYWLTKNLPTCPDCPDIYAENASNSLPYSYASDLRYSTKSDFTVTTRTRPFFVAANTTRSSRSPVSGRSLASDQRTPVVRHKRATAPQ